LGRGSSEGWNYTPFPTSPPLHTLCSGGWGSSGGSVV